MLDTLKLNLILEFMTGYDQDSKPIFSKVTISNLREDLTSNELYQIAVVFGTLISHNLTDIQAVLTHRVNAPQQP